MTFVVYFLLVLSGIGMIYGLMKYRQGYPWAQSFTVVCAVITLLLAFYTLMPNRSHQRTARKHREQQEQYEKIISEKAGRHLAQEYGDANILVLARNQNESPLLSGLEEGIGDQATMDVVVPDFGEQYGESSEDMPMEMEMEMMEMMEPETMDRMIEKNLQNHELIISLIGLPYGVERMELWKSRNPPLAVIADTGNYMQMGQLANKIKNGQITLITVRRPDTKWELEKIPKDVDEAFEERYLMITPDNVERIAKEHPEVFEGDF